MTAEANSSVPVAPPTYVSRRFKNMVTWGAMVVGGLIGLSFLLSIIDWSVTGAPWFRQLLIEHYPVMVGLPSAALLAYLIVVLFEARFDKIEMSIGTLIKFRGASGPVILWILVFSTITIAIRLLW
ncbi:hypothetical protein [Kribbella jiaozuonensis]|uniref:Uncharacterized protein n=1 Tax=Kribbella jiaozuonensis TaxID=2575441 RepID=A0A4U3M269_9ACTN|nr:hypothetical protein [Kribbella jiaozuonensis]TKK82825.1 hypothetical protein FDA38_08720 [Kribbella jiaozuonensis]